MANLDEVVYDSFYTYAGMVIADRAIVDVRDCLKPSPRVLLYNQYLNKNFSNKPFIKSASIVGDALKTFYYHGDSACYDMYCRMAAPYAMRYPLNNFHGNYGTLEEGSPAAMRYTEMRLSELSTKHLFDGLNHNAIAEWRDNFDETDKSPSCLPSIGYYNICNGSIGLGIGISSSIPQFNLREVNNALVKLIQNPEIDFSEIYCAPDFATGGTITNAAEVRESLRKGHGSSCRIRSTITYDSKKHELLISDLPYGVYSKTIVRQIQEKVLEDENYGIIHIYDNSADTAEICLELSKHANPSIMIKKLYKDTSLENWFSINMIMLDKGRFPRVFGWKEACQAYIDHIRECKTRELKFELDGLIHRNHILDGLLIATANIDEVVYLIRHSESVAAAKAGLMKTYKLDEEQAKAILDLKLQRLAKLEAVKINDEREKNAYEISRLEHILNTPSEINNLLIAALQDVANKFGDARRTKVANLMDAEEEEVEEYEVMLNIYDGKIKVVKKRVAGQIIDTTNLGTLIGISVDGRMYHSRVGDIVEGKVYSVDTLFGADIVQVYDLEEIKKHQYIVFATEEGFLKKSTTNEYNYTGRNGNKMLKLHANDNIIAALLANDNTIIEVGYASGLTKNMDSAAIPVTTKSALGSQPIKKDTIKYMKRMN